MRRTIARTALVFAGVLSMVALVGCGGSSKTTAPAPTPPAPMPVTIEGLPDGHTLAEGEIPAGEMRVVADADGMRTTVTCAAGGPACVIAVPDEGDPTSTGGAVTVATISYTAIELPEGHKLMAGTLPVGASLNVSPDNAGGVRTVVTCTGDAACVVTRMDDGAESTGGAITVTTYTAIATLGLPTGYTLAAGTIPAGESRQVHDDGEGKRTTVTCAAGGPACVVNSVAGTLEWTGGELTTGTISYTIGDLARLPSGHSLRSGTIDAGESQVVADANGMRTTVMCPADGEDCVIAVADDGSATATGGEPTVTTISYTAIELPDGHQLMAGTIPAGETRVALDANGRRTVVTCPGGDDAEACAVTLTADGAESTGGGITVETYSYAAVAGLPGDHTLTTQTIPAGETRLAKAYSRGRTYSVSCPGGDGAQACNLVVAEDSSVESRGGAATVTTETNEMIWQANNGRDGDSNGAHARGLVNRIGGAGAAATAAATQLGDVTDYTRAADGAATPPVRAVNGLVQGTVTGGPTAVMRWTRGTRPTFDVTLPSTAFTTRSPDASAGTLLVDSTSETPSLGTGWNGRSLSGSFFQEKKIMHAVVYTDADPPAGYVAGTPVRTVSGSGGLDLSTDPDVTAAFAQLASVQDLEIDVSSSIGTDVKVTIPAATMRTLRQGGAQTALSGVTVTYTDAEGDSQTQAVTMSCASGSTCGSMTGGSNPGLTGAWNIAVPAVPEVPGTEDDIHLIFGSWLVLPEDASSPASNIASYNFGSFAYGVLGATGGTPRTQANLDASFADGQYTFTGRAAGLYMTATMAGTGSSRAASSAEVGSFTADAALTVTRATTFTGATGTVTNFRENNRPLGWSMELENTGPGAAAGVDLFEGTTDLETTSGLEASGNWGVQFYFEPGMGAEHAAGTFNASTPAAENRALHVVGAFGAENQDN